MAPARSKKKAKSGSKAKSKKSAKKVLQAKARKTSPRKAAAKKVPKKKAAPKKAAPKKAAAPKKPLAPEVTQALAQAEVEGLINRLPPPVQPVVKLLRKIVLEVAPEASEQLDHGAPAYFVNGVFARIEPGEREVLVRFLKGGELPSAAELGGEGEVRTMAFQNESDLRETVLRKVVREAVMLNLSRGGSAASSVPQA
jgi:hypothetical protein